MRERVSGNKIIIMLYIVKTVFFATKLLKEVNMILHLKHTQQRYLVHNLKHNNQKSVVTVLSNDGSYSIQTTRPNGAKSSF